MFRRRITSDFNREIRAHIDLEADRLTAEGMDPETARLEAVRRFGNVLQSQERFHESRRTVWIDRTLQDLRFAIRGLRKTPSFAAIVVLTFALGIGVNTAVFASINGFFLRPLGGVRDPNALVVVGAEQGRGTLVRVSYPDYRDLKTKTTAFDDIAGLSMEVVGIRDGGRPESVLAAFTTSNYFDMLGVRAGIGRLYRTGEGDIAGEAPVVVLGYRFWQRRFSGDPGIVGRTVRVNAVPYTIVGISPEAFRGTYSIVDFDAYIPLGQKQVHFPGSERALENRDSRSLLTMARLRDGVSLAEAQAEVEVLSASLAAEYPQENSGVAYRLFPESMARPEPSMLAGTAPLVITLFLGLSSVVLLVACLNVANLLLVRSSTRRRELNVRMALGAGRWRIARQLLTETLLMAGLGAVLGGFVGSWAAKALGSLRIGGTLPITIDMPLDFRVYAYLAIVTVGAGVLVAIWPALGLRRVREGDLHVAARSDAARGGNAKTRSVLVVGQIAMSTVLLVAAGLLIHSLDEVEHLELGYTPAGLLNVTVDTTQVGYDRQRTGIFRDQLLERVRTLPGVAVASIAAFVPHGYAWSTRSVWVEGRDLGGRQRPPTAGVNAVSEDYFATLRIPIIAGRALDVRDDGNRAAVAVISETMAARLWEGAPPLGRRFSMEGPEGPWIEVVGISGDGLYGLMPVDGPVNFFFVPWRQQQENTLISLQVRSAAVPPESLAPTVEAQIAALEPDLPVMDVRPQEDLLLNANGVLMLRVAVLFAAIPGLIGLFLAGIGIYGVLGYAVTERIPEMGIRMALGARRSEIRRMVLAQAGVLTGVGLAIGLGFGFAIARLFQPILAPDTSTFIVVPVGLSLAALLAAYFPARRATKVDPLVALRHD